MTIPARRWPALRRIARARRLGAKALGFIARACVLYYSIIGISVTLLEATVPAAQTVALAVTLVAALVLGLEALLARS